MMKKTISIILSAIFAVYLCLSVTACDLIRVSERPLDSGEAVEYSINYVLNGGVNAENNPDSYTGKETIELGDAYNKRCEFLGWYDNADFDGKSITTIPKGSSGDITLYAKYDGPIVFSYTDRKEPVTLYGKPLVLTYTSETAEHYRTLFESIISDIEKGELPYDAVIRKVVEYNQGYADILDQDRIATIIADMTANASDYAMESEIYDLLVSFSINQNLIDLAFADSKYKRNYYDGMSDQEIEEYVSSIDPDEAISIGDIDVQMNSVLNDYFSGDKDAFTAIKEYSALANEYAIKNGYKNYMEYAYEKEYYRDYAVEDTDDLKLYITSYVLPLSERVYDKYLEYVTELSEEEYGQLMSIRNDFYAYYMDYVDKYSEYIGGDYLKNYDYYFTSGNYFYSAVRNDNVTGYTWSFSDGTPFMFMGKNYQDVCTFIHEFGHYNAALTGGGDEYASYDIAETQSQGNELMFYKYLCDKGLLSTNVGKTFFAEKLEDMLLAIVEGYLINEMEKFVYCNGLEDVTEREFYDKWTGICNQSGIGSYSRYNSWMINTILNYRCYYISYATSAVASIELSALSFEDYDQAVASYKKIYAAYPDRKTFTEVLTTAGLYSVFSEDAYKLMENIVL